jgi:DNA modification methylase/ParB-like chromosome segregation protein Spo0J
MPWEIDPIVEIFPPLDGREFEALVQDVRDHGILEPIKTFEGKVIDGRNRLRVAELLGIDPPIEEWDGNGDKLMYVLSMNMHRRHLTESQRAACAAEAMEYYKAEAAKRQDAARRRKGKKGAAVAGGDGQSAMPAPEASRPARDDAAEVFKVSPRSVQRAMKVLKESPEMHAMVKAGKRTVHQSERAVDRQKRREALQARAAAVGRDGIDRPFSFINADVIEATSAIPDGHARVVFADPPYNEGIDYGRGKDADLKTNVEYQDFCISWMKEASRILAADGSFWVLISEDWADFYGVWLRNCGFHRRRWIVVHEAFGQNVEDNFGKTNRHLFYCVKNKKNYIFNRDAVKRVSWREAHGDRRACPDGALRDALWTMDRVMDNHPGRMPDSPTQLPVDLLAPIVGVSSHPGDVVVDLFSGSASMGEACLTAADGMRRFVGIDEIEANCRLGAARLELVMEKQASIDPAPAT